MDTAMVTIPLKDYEELRKIRREATVVQYQTFNGERHIYQGKDELISDLVKKLNKANNDLDKEVELSKQKIRFTEKQVGELVEEINKIKSKWYYKLINGEK